MEVGPGRLQDALRGLDVVGLTRREDVYHTLRCTLVARREEIDAFDAAFAAYWERAPRTPAPEIGLETPRLEPSAAAADDRTRGRRRRRRGEESTMLLASLTRRAPAPARLRRHDRLRAAPAAAADGASARRRARGGARAACGPESSGDVLDARRTLRRAMRTQGLPLDPAFRRRKQVPRKLVFLCDVSGSMEPYARAMVMFMQAVTAAGRQVEAFAFGTRITRLTPHLRTLDPARSLARAGALMPDWGGGTRIGESLRGYNERVGPARHDARGGRGDRLGRLGARRPRPARSRARPDRPPGAPAGVGEPAQGPRRASRRWPAACASRCTTPTCSSRGTTWSRSRRWPTCSRSGGSARLGGRDELGLESVSGYRAPASLPCRGCMVDPGRGRRA